MFGVGLPCRCEHQLNRGQRTRFGASCHASRRPTINSVAQTRHPQFKPDGSPIEGLPRPVAPNEHATYSRWRITSHPCSLAWLLQNLIPIILDVMRQPVRRDRPESRHAGGTRASPPRPTWRQPVTTLRKGHRHTVHTRDRVESERAIPRKLLRGYSSASLLMIRPLPHPTSSTRMPLASRSVSPGVSGRMCISSDESTDCPLSSAITSWNRPTSRGAPLLT
jgi:hypothetical protein